MSQRTGATSNTTEVTLHYAGRDINPGDKMRHDRAGDPMMAATEALARPAPPEPTDDFWNPVDKP